VNPGKHQIIGTLGSDEKRTTVDLAEGESKSIELELAGAPDTATPPSGDKDKDKGKDKKGETKLNTLVWVGGGIAAAGLAVGAITGIMAFSIKSDVDSRCDAQHRCKQEVDHLWDDIDRGVLMGNISTGAFVVAAIGGGILVYGLLNPQRAEPISPTSSSAFGRGSAKIRILPSPFGLAGTF
jgi:hypothetical protein